MTHNTEETIQELRDENIELKLGSIRKEISALDSKMGLIKTDLHRHLDVILEQTSKTNGSVASALERIAMLEREDNKRKLEELQNEFKNYKKQMGFWYTISTRKWVAGLIIAVMYAFAIQEFRDAFFKLFGLAG